MVWTGFNALEAARQEKGPLRRFAACSPLITRIWQIRRIWRTSEYLRILKNTWDQLDVQALKARVQVCVCARARACSACLVDRSQPPVSREPKTAPALHLGCTRFGESIEFLALLHHPTPSYTILHHPTDLFGNSKRHWFTVIHHAVSRGGAECRVGSSTARQRQQLPLQGDLGRCGEPTHTMSIDVSLKETVYGTDHFRFPQISGTLLR